MALATANDLAALGALAVNLPQSDPQAERAETLLTMAQNLALSYLRITEADVAAWPAETRGRMTVWIAEKAATRLNVSAAPNVDPYGTPPANRSMMLNRWEKEDLRSIAADAGLVSRLGLATLTITRENDLITPISDYDEDPFG